MNKIIGGLFVFIFILTSGCQKEDDSTFINTFQENAKLKCVLQYSSIDSDEPNSIVEEYEYDEKDRISRVSSPMYQDGVIVGTIKYDLYEYNSEGQLERIMNYNANTNSQTGFINLKNYIYTYSNDGKKEKEYIEYPQIGSSEYSLYKYNNNRLTRIEKFDNNDELERTVVNEYDDDGKLIKESSLAGDNQQLSYTQHSYSNGLNVQSDVYTGKDEEHIREIFRTYDENNNLIILQSNELSMLSSMMSYVLKYEYFEE